MKLNCMKNTVSSNFHGPIWIQAFLFLRPSFLFLPGFLSSSLSPNQHPERGREGEEEEKEWRVRVQQCGKVRFWVEYFSGLFLLHTSTLLASLDLSFNLGFLIMLTHKPLLSLRSRVTGLGSWTHFSQGCPALFLCPSTLVFSLCYSGVDMGNWRGR